MMDNDGLDEGRVDDELRSAGARWRAEHPVPQTRVDPMLFAVAPTRRSNKLLATFGGILFGESGLEISRLDLRIEFPNRLPKFQFRCFNNIIQFRFHHPTLSLFLFKTRPLCTSYQGRALPYFIIIK